MLKLNAPKELVEAFRKRFCIGRDDVYAEQKKDGSYIAHRKPLTDSIIVQHLTGKKTIATYILKEGKVDSATLDIDNDNIETVKAVQAACERLKINCRTEKTGGRGYHIWVFFGSPIGASDAIALAKLIIETSGISDEIEIFPKQAKTKNLGNPIRLPFGIHQKYGGLSHFLDDAFQPIEDPLAFLQSIKEVEEADVKRILGTHNISTGQAENPVAVLPDEASKYDLDPKNMHLIETQCPYIRELIAKANNGEHIPYPQWRGLAGVYVSFGQEGEERFHEISSKDTKSYSRDSCQKLLDDYKDNGHKPTSCEYFQCGRNPEKDCGLRPFKGRKQSPIRFGICRERKPQLDKPISIHLIQIEDAKHDNKAVSTNTMVAAVGETYHVPRRYQITCVTPTQNMSHCPFCSYREGCVIELDITDPILIEFCNSTDSQNEAILAKRARRKTGPKCKFGIVVQERIQVQELVVVPRALAIRIDNEGKVVDETGHDYRYKVIHYIGTLINIDGYFQASGVVVPNPKTQRATLLTTEMKRLSTDISTFKMTEELAAEFRNFQSPSDDIGGVREVADRILRDVTYNITEIYGEHRETVLLFVLLTTHSILNFKFNESPINKGWLDIMVIGDTGQGKSRQVEKLLESIGLGLLMTGSAANRVGILYSLDTVIEGKRLLRWGAIPLNDGRLVIIDEFQKIPASQIEEFSSCRSSGLLKVDRSVKGEHKARVRLVLLANPVTNEPMSDQVYGVVVLKFQRPADIRRLDVAIFVAKDDLDTKDVVYKLKNERSKIPQAINGELLKQSLLWAWTRKPEDVIFTSEASAEIMQQAKDLVGKYEVSDIPLVSTDVHEKLARLSVAIASLLHSTDDSHEKVIVRPEHVLYVVEKLHDVYTHKNCQLDKYAASLNERETLTDEEYVEIVQEIVDKIQSETYKGATINILKAILMNDFLKLGELGDKFSYGAKVIRDRLGILEKRNMLSMTSKGYKKTKKAVIFLKRYFNQAILSAEGTEGTNDSGKNHTPDFK